MAFIRISDLRPLIAKKAGRFYSGTADSSNNTTTLMRDADLGGYPNDFFNRMWFMCTSGNNIGVIRYVDDFVQSTGGVSWTTALPNAAQQSITWELHQYEPAWLLDALADAVRNLYPSLAREFFAPIGVGGSPIANPSFELFGSTGVPSEWSKAGSITVARSGLAWRSPSSVAFSGSTGTIEYPDTNSVNADVMTRLLGKTITVHAMVQSGDDSQSRIRVVADGSTTNGAYNTSTDTWLKLSSGSVSITSTSNMPKIYAVYDSATSAAYWDTIWIEGAQTDYLVIPRHAFPNGLARVFAERGAPDDESDGGLVPLSDWKYGRTELVGVDTSYDYVRVGKRWYGHVIWAKALSPLSVPTTLTDTTTYIELTIDEARLLVVEAALVLLDRVKSAVPLASQATIEERRVSLLREKRALEDAFSSPSSSADLPPFWGHM